MKQVYLGTTLEAQDYLEFGRTASSQGSSKSALLKSITLELLAHEKARSDPPHGGSASLLPSPPESPGPERS
jgi:hypothetical protein